MDTNLKRSKKIRAFLYRMFALGAFLCMVVTGICGRNALHAFTQSGTKILTGDFYYLPQFQTYMEELYNNALIGFAGVGDDNGYAIADSKASSISYNAKLSFLSAISQENGDIIYAIKKFNHRNASGDLVSNEEQSNIDYPLFSTHDGHLLLPDDMQLCFYWDRTNGTVFFLGNTTEDSAEHTDVSSGEPVQEAAGQYKPNHTEARSMKLMLAVRSDGAFKGPTLAAFDTMAKNYQYILITFLASTFATLLFLLLSVLSKKAYAESKQVYGKFSGKVLLEVKLILIAVMGFIFWWNRIALWGYLTASTGPLLIGLFFPTGCLLYLLWVDLCQNEGGVFVNSLPARLVRFMQEFVGSCHWYRILMIIGTCILINAVASVVAGAILLYIYHFPRQTPGAYALIRNFPYMHAISIILLVCGAMLFIFYFFLRHFAKDTKRIADRLSQIQLGDLKEPLTLSKGSLLKNVATDINRLEDNIDTAVEQKNRSNKMRVELITNISHDLKTPLTSIINYADLLCEEELPPQAAEYATSLKAKAYRLKKMVQDVFDISKATSGNLPVENHALDLAKLVRQTLADMEERIGTSSLQFKTIIADEPLMIMADGDKLYRVFQNLIVNALQYSLEGSRVHIHLSAKDGWAYATMKNTSKWELDFDTEEIMERFVRADASRTTEGSGLGLSIVQSFTEACGGTFTITTDADMFTACVRFPLLPQTEDAVEEAEPDTRTDIYSVG